MQELEIGFNEAGQRFDKYLHKALPGAGSSLLYKQLRRKNITLNGRNSEGREILQAGDRVQLFFSEETFLKFRGRTTQDGARPDGSNLRRTYERTAFRAAGSRAAEYRRAYQILKGVTVLYEDRHILILNKPAGILTQKAGAGDFSLNEWMIGYLLQSGAYTEEELLTFHPSICNRLDRNTSGLVLCGKSLPGSQALSLLLKEHLLRKFYWTICHGRLTEEKTVNGYLNKNSVENKVTVLVNDDSKPVPAAFAPIRTRYTPLETSDAYTLLEVELFTGKTHQIRAQLASIGHPLLGDTKYGKRRDNSETERAFHLKHQLLHAEHVIFPEWENVSAELTAYEEVLRPLGGKRIQAPLPELFQRIRDSIWK